MILEHNHRKDKKKKNFIIVGFGLVLILLIAGIFYMVNENGKTKVKIETNKGNIVLELYSDKAPITVENFLEYVNEGFYDGTIFHRVISGFMVQGGGYTENGNEKNTKAPIKLESNNGLSNERGTIAMARTNVLNSATSQFFINLVDNDFLDYGTRDEGYAVFGKVIEGMDVVDEIGQVSVDGSDKPLEDVVIINVSVI